MKLILAQPQPEIVLSLSSGASKALACITSDGGTLEKAGGHWLMPAGLPIFEGDVFELVTRGVLKLKPPAEEAEEIANAAAVADEVRRRDDHNFAICVKPLDLLQLIEGFLLLTKAGGVPDKTMQFFIATAKVMSQRLGSVLGPATTAFTRHRCEVTFSAGGAGTWPVLGKDAD
jgi:hypothetical protein